jgi:hypothetical protein
VPNDTNDPLDENVDTRLILPRRRKNGRRNREKADKNYSSQNTTTHKPS